MGSCNLNEDEKFVQMVIDFMEPTQEVIPINKSSIPLHQNPSLLSLKNILEEVSTDEVKVLEKILFFLKDMGRTKNVKEFVVLRLKVEGYKASLCKTSWTSNFDHPSGDYEYIDIKLDSENGKRRLIVDLDFRSQFELARPTQLYKDLTNAVPCIFVGTEKKLKNIVSLLCSAAKQSLKDSGLHIPPWRKVSYMKSKWDCYKVSFPSSARTRNCNSFICGSPRFSYLTCFDE